MNAETKHTPGPWEEIGLSVRVATRGIIATCPTPQGGGVMECFHNTRLIAAAPQMAEALQAEEEADRLFDAADEYTHRAEGEGWLNDPTGSMHVTEAWDRARQAREHAKELRRLRSPKGWRLIR